MPTILVTRCTVMHTCHIFTAVAVTIASTHYAYPQWDGQAELA